MIAQRFCIKLDKLLLIHSGPSFKDEIWERLKKQQFRTPNDIRIFLRNESNLKSKHYDCIRMFSKIFANFHVATKQNVCDIKVHIQHDFSNLLFQWKHLYFGGLFFSTDWLMRMYVLKYCPELLVFLKPKTTSNRDEKYVKMYQTISTNG